MDLDTIMNTKIEAAVTLMLRTRDATINRLEENIIDGRHDINELKEQVRKLKATVAGLNTANELLELNMEAIKFRAEQERDVPQARMLEDKVTGLITANELMKQDMEAIKFRAEQERDSSMEKEKTIMKKVADALYAAAEDNIDTFDMDADMNDLFSATTVTSNTQPIVVAPKKQTSSPVRKKARTAATITIALDDPRRRPVFVAEDISDFSDDDDDMLVKDYSDNCPNANNVGYYEHTYIGGGRRPKCIKCKRDDDVRYIQDNDGKGFYVCKTCNMRHHRFHRHDNGRAYNVQTWFNAA